MGRIRYMEDMSKWEQEFTFYYPVKVRFSETDMFGHLNNTVPFVYFEGARIRLFQQLGFMDKWIGPDSETMIVTADLQCDFLKQVYFDEELKIYVKVHSVGTSSVDLHYMGKNSEGSICFVGRGTMVQVSKSTGKSKAWSDEMRKSLIHFH